MKTSTIFQYIQSTCILLLLSFPCLTIHAQWERTNGPFYPQVYQITANGNTLLAGTVQRMNRSVNNAASWTQATLLGNMSAFLGNMSAYGYIGQYCIAGNVTGDVYRSTDDGISWTTIPHSPMRSKIVNIVTIGNSVFAATAGDGVFVSADSGNYWLAANTGITDKNIRSMVNSNGNLFAATSSGVFVSVDHGASWTLTTNGFSTTYVSSLAANGTTVYAGKYGSLYTSSNNGAQWNLLHDGFNGIVMNLAVKGSVIFAATDYYLYRSIDGGTTWSDVSTPQSRKGISTIIFYGNDVYVGNRIGIWKSGDNGITWSYASVGLHSNWLSSLAATGTSIIARDMYGTVYGSIDGGNTWNLNSVCDTFDLFDFDIVAANGNDLYASGSAAGILKSIDQGNTWTKIDSNWTFGINSFVFSGNTIYACTQFQGILVSTNNGYTWSAINNGITNLNVKTVLVTPNAMYAGTAGAGVFISTNNGVSWIPTSSGMGNLNITCLTADNTTIYAGTENRAYKSINGGSTWTQLPGVSGQIKAIGINNSKVIIAGIANIYYSSNSDASWINITDNYPGVCGSFAMTTENIYIGDIMGGVWKRSLSTVGINDISINSSAKTYPNPTSGALNIDLEKTFRDIKIEIYNITGQLVSSERFENIKYIKTEIRGEKGIYFIKIQSERGTEAVKIVKN